MLNNEYCIFKTYKSYLLNISKIALNVINTGYISNLPVHMLNILMTFNGVSSEEEISPSPKPTLPCMDIVSNKLLNGS